ncbi:MAG: tetratricopeptide repeat protein [Vicinamibacterales bacterium]
MGTRRIGDRGPAWIGWLRAVCLVVGVATTSSAQSGAVRGIVVDSEGQPIKGAVIKAANPNGRPTQITSTSDGKGRFAMIGLVGGAWSFVAEAPGFMPQQGRSMVRSSVTGNAPLEFVMTRVVAPAPTAVSRQIENELAAAGALRAEGKFDQAIAAYQEIATKNPTLTSVQLVIGDAWRQRGAKEAGPSRVASLDRALATFEVVLQADPGNERARIELALTQLVKGNHDDAERMVAGGAVAGASREMVYALAEVRFSKGDTAGAEDLFKRAAAMDPVWLRPRLQLGLIAFRKGDKAGAAAYFQAVSAADAESPEATEARGYLKELGF